MPKAEARVIGDLMLPPVRVWWRESHKSKAFLQGGHVEFIMFEDVHGKEVYVNPNRVIWVREYGEQNTEISCGAEDKFTVRLSPLQAVAMLGVEIR
jgi:hypothetical protein